MEKITAANWDDVYDMSYSVQALREIGVKFGCMDSDNFWMVREKARMLNGAYTPINIPGDDLMRFLHKSLDDPDKVSYTKNADKGREDLQTRTTLADYCDKFELEIPTTVPRCESLTPANAYESRYHNLADAVRAYFNSKAETNRLKKIVQEMI